MNRRTRRAVAQTDGACSGNPGPGRWAAILTYKGKRRVLSGHARLTTNNAMELRAALRAVRAARRIDAPLTVVSDSEYVVKGATEWLPGWKRRGWRTAANKPVANRGLWEHLDAAIEAHPGGVEFVWTRGHAGHELNEEADRIARSEAETAS